MFDLKELVEYFPAILTALIVAPLGVYLKSRMKNLANHDDLTKALEQLEKTTEAVEVIKGQLNEKHWVKQQVWDTKRQAYEEILSYLFLTKEYVDNQVTYLEGYTDCFIFIGGTVYEMEDEEYQKSYEEHVRSEQRQFSEKYESTEAKKKRQELSDNTRKSYTKLERVFSIKSIYIDPELSRIEALLSKLRHRLYDDQPKQEAEDFIGDFIERLIEHYVKTGELINEIIVLTRELATEDLKLSTK